eukprot:1151621-Pelagomonas_calceolata.AAC.2
MHGKPRLPPQTPLLCQTPPPPSPFQGPLTPQKAWSAEWMEQHLSPEFRVALEDQLGHATVGKEVVMRSKKSETRG